MSTGRVTIFKPRSEEERLCRVISYKKQLENIMRQKNIQKSKAALKPGISYRRSKPSKIYNKTTSSETNPIKLVIEFDAAEQMMKEKQFYDSTISSSESFKPRNSDSENDMKLSPPFYPIVLLDRNEINQYFKKENENESHQNRIPVVPPPRPAVSRRGRSSKFGHIIVHEYTPGSIVWAQLQGYPAWPAMVEDEPGADVCFWLNESCDKILLYHVTFLDTKRVSRAWLPPDKIHPFGSGSSSYSQQVIRQKIEIKRKRRKGKHLISQSKKAVQLAEIALQMSLEKRLETFSFSKLWSKNPGESESRMNSLLAEWSKKHSNPDISKMNLDSKPNCTVPENPSIEIIKTIKEEEKYYTSNIPSTSSEVADKKNNQGVNNNINTMQVSEDIVKKKPYLLSEKATKQENSPLKRKVKVPSTIIDSLNIDCVDVESIIQENIISSSNLIVSNTSL